MNYPSIRMDIDRVHAAELGLTQKDVVDNVITALNSNIMIAPNYWVDYKTGNDYFLSVQYAEHGKPAIHNLVDLKQIPLRAPNLKEPTTLDSVVKLVNLQSPTEIDHYQIQRVVDIYVTPVGRGSGQAARRAFSRPSPTRSSPRTSASPCAAWSTAWMNPSRASALGFSLSFMLLFLILVAQFKSFIDPFLIMLAIPMGFVGVLIILPLTHTTLNVMSLMGVLMLIGIADSNSILIVDFAHKLEEQGMSVTDAVVTACRVRLRPILMTSLATIIGMIPMAMKLGEGGEQYTPMARAIIGGLTSSVLLTVFIVPAAYLLVYGRKERNASRITNVVIVSVILLTAARTSIVASPAYGAAHRAADRPAGPTLTLQQAEAIALQNHPQIQAAQYEVNYANQQIVENRAAYYPDDDWRYHRLAGQRSCRASAPGIFPPPGFSTASGQGVLVQPADHRFRPHFKSGGAARALQAQAAAQNRAGHALRRSAAGQSRLFRRSARPGRGEGRAGNRRRAPTAERSGDRTREEPAEIAARRQLRRSERIPGEAPAVRRRTPCSKRSPNWAAPSVQTCPANYQLATSRCLPGRPQRPIHCSAGVGDRPEFARLRFSRDAAYKFADAERDLSRPTVSVVAVGG